MKPLSALSLLFPGLLLVIQTLAAQTVADNRRRYESGKELVRQGKYDLSQEIFRPLMQANPENPFAAYAHYLSAYALLKANKPDEAKLVLEQLQQKYPGWPEKEQADYLLANVLFEKKDYAAALAITAKIRNETLRKNAEGLKKYYLRKEPNPAPLKKLQQEHPDDRTVAEVLTDKLWFGGNADDMALAKKLDAQFSFGKAALMPVKKAETKSVYNVAVVLPFGYGTLVAEKTGRSSPIAVDVYNGIRLAQDKLAKEEGVQINVAAYDVGADAGKMTELVSKPEFQANDLVIGPINGAAMRVAVSFASQTGIPQINPITTNSQIVRGNPATYLYQASVESQASGAARFALRQFTPKTVAIFYGNTPKDSLLAHEYRRVFASGGGKVLAFKKTVTAALAPQTVEALAGGLGHVFITSPNQNVAINLVSFLEKTASQVPVVTQANWLSFPMLNYDQLERLNVHFIYPEYIDYRSEAAIGFKKAYIEKHNLIPSLYAYQGYDMMLFFGRLLKESGTGFGNALQSKTAAKGDIFAGYDFRQSQDNQYVPVTRFEKGDFVLANPVEGK